MKTPLERVGWALGSLLGVVMLAVAATAEHVEGRRKARHHDGRADVLYILAVVALVIVLLAFVGAL